MWNGLTIGDLDKTVTLEEVENALRDSGFFLEGPVTHTEYCTEHEDGDVLIEIDFDDFPTESDITEILMELMKVAEDARIH